MKKLKLAFLFITFFTWSQSLLSQNKPSLTTNLKLTQFELKTDSLKIKLPQNKSIMKQDYLSNYHDKLGVFCKFENKLLKTSNIPIRMRLGSTEYVDKLEQKVPAYMDKSN